MNQGQTKDYTLPIGPLGLLQTEVGLVAPPPSRGYFRF